MLRIATQTIDGIPACALCTLMCVSRTCRQELVKATGHCHVQLHLPTMQQLEASHTDTGPSWPKWPGTRADLSTLTACAKWIGRHACLVSDIDLKCA